jgi:hypothetical protein
MEEGQFCQSCEQRRDCQQIYEQMGNVKGPSVALSVFLVFLLPIFVFIGGLAISRMTFASLIENPFFSNLGCVFFAAAISFFVILAVRIAMVKVKRKDY